jgi:conjugative relaxase-like TrwC/TraI family protein
MLKITKIKSTGAGGSKQLDYLKVEAKLGYDAKGASSKLGAGFALGGMAKTLGFEGKLHDGDQHFELLKAVAQGIDPRDGQRKIQGPEDKHVQGWDLTFSAPKSVSVVWSLASDAEREKIAEAKMRAVGKVIDYIEREGLAVSRRGKAGIVKEAGKVVAVASSHWENRALDPQLHDHVFLANFVEHSEGFGTVETKAIYDAKILLGDIYQAALADEMEKLGWKSQPREDLKAGVVCELAGVGEVSGEFGLKRTAEMEQWIKDNREKYGFSSDEAAEAAAVKALMKNSKARDKAAIASRKEKASDEDRDIDLLTKKWHEEAAERGITTEGMKGANRDSEIVLREYDHALALLNLQTSMEEGGGAAVSRQIAKRSAFEEAMKAGKKLDEALRLAEDFVETHLVFAGRDRNELDVFTTPEILATEQKVFDWAVEASKSKKGGVSERSIAKAIAKFEKDSEGKIKIQGETLEAIELAAGPGEVAVITGKAGTGKTTMLKPVAMAFRAEGWKIHGTAIAGKAADGLTGIADTTENLAKTLIEIKSGKLALKDKTLLLLDESAMTDSMRVKQLVDHIQAARAKGNRVKVIFLGDQEQLQAIGLGGMHAALAKEIGSKELRTVYRQKTEGEKAAANALEAGDAGAALEHWKSLGRYHAAKDQQALALAVAEKFTATEAGYGDKTFTVETRSLARRVNAAVREKRIALGEIDGGYEIETYDPNEKADFKTGISVGDRLSFLKGSISDQKIQVWDDKKNVWETRDKINSKKALQNGNFGTVEDVEDTGKGLLIQVRLDDGRRVKFDTDLYKTFALGYGQTGFKQQGVTKKENHFIATTGDKHYGYVAGSRHEHDCYFWTTEDCEQNIVRSLSRDGKTETASEQVNRILMTDEGLADAQRRLEKLRASVSSSLALVEHAKIGVSRAVAALAAETDKAMKPTRKKELKEAREELENRKTRAMLHADGVEGLDAKIGAEKARREAERQETARKEAQRLIAEQQRKAAETARLQAEQDERLREEAAEKEKCPNLEHPSEPQNQPERPALSKTDQEILASFDWQKGTVKKQEKAPTEKTEVKKQSLQPRVSEDITKKAKERVAKAAQDDHKQVAKETETSGRGLKGMLNMASGFFGKGKSGEKSPEDLKKEARALWKENGVKSRHETFQAGRAAERGDTKTLKENLDTGLVDLDRQATEKPGNLFHSLARATSLVFKKYDEAVAMVADYAKSKGFDPDAMMKETITVKNESTKKDEQKTPDEIRNAGIVKESEKNKDDRQIEASAALMLGYTGQGKVAPTPYGSTIEVAIWQNPDQSKTKKQTMTVLEAADGKTYGIKTGVLCGFEGKKEELGRHAIDLLRENLGAADLKIQLPTADAIARGERPVLSVQTPDGPRKIGLEKNAAGQDVWIAKPEGKMSRGPGMYEVSTPLKKAIEKGMAVGGGKEDGKDEEQTASRGKAKGLSMRIGRSRGRGQDGPVLGG